jgi:hypothetical protein
MQNLSAELVSLNEQICRLRAGRTRGRWLDFAGKKRALFAEQRRHEGVDPEAVETALRATLHLAGDPKGYASHPAAKLLAAIHHHVRETIPRAPDGAEFRQGKYSGTGEPPLVSRQIPRPVPAVLPLLDRAPGNPLCLGQQRAQPRKIGANRSLRGLQG